MLTQNLGGQRNIIMVFFQSGLWKASRPDPQQTNQYQLDAQYQSLFSHLGDGIIHPLNNWGQKDNIIDSMYHKRGHADFSLLLHFFTHLKHASDKWLYPFHADLPFDSPHWIQIKYCKLIFLSVGRVRINNISHLLQLIKSQSFNIFLWCVTFFVNINYFKNLPGDIKKRDVKLNKLDKQLIIIYRYCYNY